MAGGSTGAGSTNSTYDEKQNYTVPLILMIMLFFLFGSVTVLNDILIPHLKELFDLKNWQAMLVQSCFFGAYFIVGFPAGWIIGKIGYKKGIILGLILMAIGMLLFIPASNLVIYEFFLFALFIIGSGITILQTAANPYTAALGKPEKAGMRMNLAGTLNSVATTFMPLIGSALIFIEGTKAEKAEAVQLPYVGLALFVGLLALVISQVKLPKVIDTESATEEAEEGSGESIFRFKHLVLGALAIFFYVGAEVACGSIIIDYLGQADMGSLGKVDAAVYVSIYWGGLMVGRFLGIFLLQKVKMQKAIVVVSGIALLLTITTMLTSGSVALWSLCSIGLCCSIMWPCIFPLGIAGLGKETGKGSGLMVAMIVGGALIPPLQGILADTIGYHMSFILVVISFAYILFYGLIGHKVTHPEALKNLEENK